jgi:DNA-binding CsgD family transcriptional regulator
MSPAHHITEFDEPASHVAAGAGLFAPAPHAAPPAFTQLLRHVNRPGPVEELDHNVEISREATSAILAAVCSVLDRHPDPLFIVDAERRLQFRNLTARRVLETRSGLMQQRGRLSTGSIPDDRRLESLLAAIQTGSVSARPRTRGLRFHRAGAGRSWCVIVHPLPSRPPGGGSHSNSLFLLHTVARMHARTALGPLLRDLFGLTRAEAAAALTVVKTGSVGIAAQELSVSRETIRSHLKAVFRKCDIHSTLQLAALVRSTSLFAGPDRRRERAL